MQEARVLMNNKAEMTMDDLREVLLENEVKSFDPVAEAFKVHLPVNRGHFRSRVSTGANCSVSPRAVHTVPKICFRARRRTEQTSRSALSPRQISKTIFLNMLVSKLHDT